MRLEGEVERERRLSWRSLWDCAGEREGRSDVAVGEEGLVLEIIWEKAWRIHT